MNTMLDLHELARATIALFVLVDPIGMLPFMAPLAMKMDSMQRKHMIHIVTLTATAILFGFAVAGLQLLHVFGISISSFGIAGGLLLVAISLQILLNGWKIDGSGDENAVVPLAFPLLVGPGAITTVIITLDQAGIVISLLSIAIVIGLTILTFKFINPINRFLGKTGSLVISRLMAIFVAAIGIEYVLEGLQQFLTR